MKLFLLTDGSVNPKRGIGFGAYLTFSEIPDDLEELKEKIKIKRFENTSSTKLELQTLLWALSEISEREIVSYTDSQNIVGLLSRKERLIENDFCSKGGRRLRNQDLYREFYEVVETFDIELRSIEGHKPSKNKDRIDEVFTLVDRASRNALRSHSKGSV